jgi:hypothetical protein
MADPATVATTATTANTATAAWSCHHYCYFISSSFSDFQISFFFFFFVFFFDADGEESGADWGGKGGALGAKNTDVAAAVGGGVGRSDWTPIARLFDNLQRKRNECF